MKSLKYMLLFIGATSLLLSCKGNYEMEMETIINADGSCTRSVEIPVDSAYFAGDHSENPFPFDIIDSWKIVTEEILDTIKSGDTLKVNRRYKSKASKSFPSVESLGNSFYFKDESWDSLVPVLNFEKRFKWFYTFYHYEETFPAINPFEKIPISNYLTSQEVKTWFGEEKELYLGKSGADISDMLSEIEFKVNKWMNRNFYEELFDFHVNHYEYFEGIPVSRSELLALKDSIFLTNMTYVESSDPLEFEMDSVLNLFFETDVHFDPKGELDDQLEAYLEEAFSFLNYYARTLNYQLILPGKIIKANAPFIYGNSGTWIVDANKFMINKYTVSATSKKVNLWAFILTGLLVVFSILGLMIKRK